MLAEYTDFLFKNYKKENFIELAVDKLVELLPEDKKSKDFAIYLLQVLQNELILLPNNYSVNLILHTVCKNDVRIYLTPNETKIIEILAENKGEIVKYRELIEKIWKYADDISILKVNMSNLRKKIDLPIRSVKGIGYIID